MRIYRRIADLVTGLRAAVAPVIVWLGHTRGEESLATVVYIVLGDWIADHLDGTLARLDPEGKTSWLGENDLKIDVLIAMAVAVYLGVAGFIPLAWALAYLAVWLVFFGLYGVSKGAGILFQALVYAYFFWLASQISLMAVVWVACWIVILLILRWQRVAHELVPEALEVVSMFFRR